MTSCATSSVDTALLRLADAAGGALLGLDTSGPLASLCLVAWHSRDVRELQIPAHAMTAERLADTLARELGAQPWKPRLAGMVVSLGPGSFTGLRVGLALAKGIALANRTPIYGVSSLEVLAASHGAGNVLVAIDARRNETYTALYRVAADCSTQILVPDGVRRPKSWATLPQPTHIIGDAARALAAECGWDVLIDDAPAPRIAFGVLQAAARIQAHQAEDLATLVPRYLRVSEAERQA